jgi:NADH-quinone oxidoreductase subunit G
VTIAALRQDLARSGAGNGSALAGVLSPFLTCEEAFLLAKYLKGLSPRARLALGPVPVVGEDDTYPKDRKGQPVQPVKFTIHAEKCPNRRGVEEILRHFQGEVLSFERLVDAAGKGELQAIYVAAGYPPRSPGWLTQEQANSLCKAPLLIVQDFFASLATERATYVIPSSSFAEKDGTFVNHKGLAQALHWAVRRTPDWRTDGQVFLDLLDRRGLVHAPSLRQEMGREIPFFAPLATGNIGDQGIPLAEGR